ncbi:MAG: hypothetical protein JW986_07405 [Methanotrichaceae archaeon]|nr:hypothetical protein [Methanotrichaceae archaeon]
MERIDWTMVDYRRRAEERPAVGDATLEPEDEYQMERDGNGQCKAN